ncbi:AraC family transcriptional regulator [Maricurvus nonylphenolicus]|uniref:AraC family transcriptional regulator n=1 Tax=Maricurvus nonylphenolicus TaxID=1008307 RepID=UPI0036F3626B
MKYGYIHVSFLQLVKEVIVAEGKDPAPWMERFELSESLLENPHARISLSRLMHISRDAIELIGKPWLGLLMGKHFQAGSMGLASWVAYTAPTVSDALASYIEFEELLTRNVRGRSSFYLDEATGNPVCQFYSMPPYNQYNYFSVDYAIAVWYQIVCQATGRTDVAKRVELEYKDIGCLDVFESYFQCPVVFGAERNAVVFKTEVANLPALHSNANSHNLARDLAEKELALLASDNLFTERVTNVIMPLLTAQPPDIDEVAEKLGMTTWTLRRRLKKENTTYQELLDKTRRDLATSYAGDTIHNFSEIAYMLGFSSPAAFHRAFRRWTGQSPGDYRKSKENTLRH